MTEQPQQPAPSANATEARGRLDGLIADKAWGGRLMSGDVAATREFHELSGMVAGADNVEIAMSGKLPDVPDSSVRLMAGTASMLREIGIRDDVIRETLSGGKVTQAEVDATTAWKTRMMKDQSFVAAFLSGEAEAREKMTLASIILSSEIKDGAAA